MGKIPLEVGCLDVLWLVATQRSVGGCLALGIWSFCTVVTWKGLPTNRTNGTNGGKARKRKQGFFRFVSFALLSVRFALAGEDLKKHPKNTKRDAGFYHRSFHELRSPPRMKTYFPRLPAGPTPGQGTRPTGWRIFVLVGPVPSPGVPSAFARAWPVVVARCLRHFHGRKRRKQRGKERAFLRLALSFSVCSVCSW